MSMNIRGILAIAALLAAAAAPARAFDLPPPVDAPEYTGSISSANGWYIRGDLGYDFKYNVGKPSYRDYAAKTDTYTNTTFDSARITGQYDVGAGAGYQFNDFLRSDLTLDYLTGALNGQSSSATRCSSRQMASTTCGFTHSQDFGALGILANGYVDLGTYWGLTPYIGAGAGVTDLNWKTMTTTKYCVNGGGKCDGTISYNDQTYSGADGWRWTYAFMAGITYDISAHTKLDFGYRYSKIAGGDMFDWGSNDASKGATGAKGRDRGLTRQEFRAGLRLTTW
jgi:opacity protein-like surface antigen